MALPKKIDLYREYKGEYVAPRAPVVVMVKPARYLAISGRGEPGGGRFVACVGALYGVAFTIKMTRKFAGEQDYAVSKLEGQWFVDIESQDIPRDQWRWKLLIRTPTFVTERERQNAVTTLLERRKAPEVREVVLETIREGTCVQMLHVGPYDREARTIALMREFAAAKGYTFAGSHHEIYLSDPRRVPAPRLRTILRQPIRRAA